MQYLKIVTCAVLSLALVACGGGGGSGGTPAGSKGTTGGGTSTPTATPARVDLTVGGNLTTVTSGTVTITAQVVDSTSSAISSQAVTFAADSGVLSGASTTTSSAGVATVTLSAGANKSNRTITVTATAGSVSSSISIPVTGTTLSLAGVSSLLIGGAAATYTVQARDAGNVAISGQTLTVASVLGNTLSSSALTTDVSGNASFTVTPSKAGSDTLTVTGLGTTATEQVSVSATNFSVVMPAASATVPTFGVNTPQTFTVQYLLSGAPVMGQAINFSTTRGTVSDIVTGLPTTSATSGSNGQASVQVTSTSAGAATLTASIPGSASVNTAVQFVATTPAAISLQATPTAISPNSGTGSTKQSSLIATVRDASGNPVPGRTVNFSAITDPSGGSISPASSPTNSNGQAVASFISGATSTATNGVVLVATVPPDPTVPGAPAISSPTASLTVSGQALFISIGYGNTITTDTNKTKYIKTFTVYVTDSNGAAVNNQVLTLSVYPNSYGKGTLTWNGTAWTYSKGSPTACPNEDVNRNGILDTGEDTNSNGKLDPGEPIVVSPGQVTTDSTGYASFTLSYGEQFTSWLFAVDITARGIVAGTESQSTYTAPYLWGLAADYTSQSNSPADVTSPFGVATDCTNPN